LCPGLTYSEFHDTAEFEGYNRTSTPRLLWMTSDQVVLDSLRALRTDQVIVVTGRINKLYTELARLSLVRTMARKLVTVFRGDQRHLA
jgi:uncharacterized protein